MGGGVGSAKLEVGSKGSQKEVEGYEPIKEM
jgi:hypothetical protein